jgi:hypothetical protein
VRFFLKKIVLLFKLLKNIYKLYLGVLSVIVYITNWGGGVLTKSHAMEGVTHDLPQV